jgi:AmmeMemoRadiSam system protein B/AmmeMemoRadiSam system protein A
MTNRSFCRLLALAVVAGALVVNCKSGSSADAPKVRQPAVAGSFYPADPKELARMVDQFLAAAVVPPLKDVVAIASPHAGYVYSGGVAAHAYAALKGRKIQRVVVIAPSHFEAFGFTSVFEGSAYATPLGQVPVDRAFAAGLVKQSSSIRFSGKGHTPSGEQGEHALEVQLPFLQRVLGQFQLVPIVMGDQDYDTCRALGRALAKLIQGNDTIIVASSDLSHYHPYDEAVKLDRKTLRAIEEWDYLSMARNFERRIWEACGGGPIVAAMIAAEQLGARQATVLKYAHSGDVTGDRSRVVGYGAVAFTKAQAQRTSVSPAFSLTAQEKTELLGIARKSVETAVKERKLYECSTRSETLSQERGAFVTLKKRGELRGCIGYVAPVKPLYQTVRDVARFAALEDHRFSPVTAKELTELEYEISVLSPLRRVVDVEQIKVGQHGLLMKNGDYEGLLLPQVPVEQGWDRQTFLEETCRKAGMNSNCWKDEDTDIFEFTAVVFNEQKL